LRQSKFALRDKVFERIPIGRACIQNPVPQVSDF